MLAIKLRRIGKKNQPSYRIVIGERRSKVRGKYTEDIGWYNPKSKENTINTERARHWLEKGAQPTESVHNLLVRTGVIKGKKHPVHSGAPVKQEESPVSPEAEKTDETAAGEGAAEQETVEAEKIEPSS